MKSKKIKLVVGLFIFTFVVLFLRMALFGRSLSPNIEYVDDNKNGIWDDVEPFIEKHSTTDEKRKALEFKFKSFQEILIDPNLGLAIRDSSLRERNQIDKMWRASACLAKVFGIEYQYKYLDLEKVILTSFARVRAYQKFNQNLSGGTYRLWDEEEFGNPCIF